MTRPIRVLPSSILILLVTATFVACGHIGTISADRCYPISKVPTTITKPGRYCLTRSLEYMAGGTAITIEADNVSIDGGGFCLLGSYSPSTTSDAVRSVDHSAISVSNLCTRGFSTGILVSHTNDAYLASPQSYGRTTLGASRNIEIRNVSVERATFQGIHVRASGDVVIRDSSVAHTGGSRTRSHSFATAIEVRANNCLIDNNRIFGLLPVGSGEGIGITLYHGRGCKISNNVITSLHEPEYGRTYGMWIRPGLGESPIITGNYVHNTDYAFGPFGTYVRNMTSDIACGTFVNRAFSLPTAQQPVVMREVDTVVTASHLKRRCRDDIDFAIQRAKTLRTPEAIYSVAAAYAELDPAKYSNDLTAWTIVAAERDHELAKAALVAPDVKPLIPGAQDAAAKVRALLEEEKTD